ncbi:CAP domain-containing protein, partial [Geobacillus zalihae]|uniref:CAP domain-containing protein n=2 Tax=Geobacillus TaxID=129337 RepID=UPI001F60FAA0
VNHYFSHNSPTYGSPFEMMKKFGISYTAAGENIAKGQRTPQEVVNAWMNSEGHRANILNKNFTHIGVGFEENGYIWTQQFIRK